MIYICSIIEGFKVTLGCFPIQASMLAVLVGVVGPQISNTDSEGRIFWVLVASHLLSVCLVLVNIVVSVGWEKVYMLVQCVNIISLFGQNLVIIYSVQTLLLSIEDDSQSKSMHEWLRIEVCVFISYIAASILFLLIRSCKRHQVQVNKEENVAEAHKRDFLEQNLALFSVMQAFAVPMITQVTLSLTVGSRESKSFDWALAAIQLLQTGLFLFCVFKSHRNMFKTWRVLIVILVEGTPVLTAICLGFNFGKI